MSRYWHDVTEYPQVECLASGRTACRSCLAGLELWLTHIGDTTIINTIFSRYAHSLQTLQEAHGVERFLSLSSVADWGDISTCLVGCLAALLIPTHQMPWQQLPRGLVQL